MTEEQKIKLALLDVNLDEVMERFVNNEGLYLRCLGKFIQDTNYNNLLSAIETKDAANAFEYAHALKGVAGNLGFNRLFEAMKVITEVFRAGSMDYDPDNLNEIKKEYELTFDVISSIQ